MIELNLVVCFLTIAEERSFSRAADRLGIAQPVVSQRMMRLEDMLKLRLLDRTSRRVELSEHGREFLPHAQAFLAAEQRAREAATAIRERIDSVLRIASSVTATEDRLRLVGDFLEAHPDSRIEVDYAQRHDILSAVRARRVDLGIVYTLPGSYEPGFTVSKIGDRVAHVVVPAGHPLAHLEELTDCAFEGRTVVVAPQKEASLIVSHFLEWLSSRGAILMPAPEPDLRSIQHFARLRGHLHLRWCDATMTRRELRDATLIPIEGAPLASELVAYSLPDIGKASVRQFHEVVRRRSATWATA